MADWNSDRRRAAVQLAMRYLGQGGPARVSRTGLRQFFVSQGVHLDPRDEAWCAAFLNSVLHGEGVRGTDSGEAASFASWGNHVRGRPQEGDIGLLPAIAGERTGHVGILTGNSRVVNGVLQYEMVSGNYHTHGVHAGGFVSRDWFNAPGGPRGNETFETIRRPTDDQGASINLPAAAVSPSPAASQPSETNIYGQPLFSDSGQPLNPTMPEGRPDASPSPSSFQEPGLSPSPSASPGEMPSPTSEIAPPFSESPSPPPSSDIYQGEPTSPVDFGPAPGEMPIYQPQSPESFSTPTDFSMPDSGITQPTSDAFIPSDYQSPSAFIPQSVNFQGQQFDTSQAPYAAAPPDISMSPFDPNEIIANANTQMFGPGEMPNNQSTPNEQSMFDAASVSGNDPSYQSGPSNQTIYDPYASPFLGGFDPSYQSPDYSADPVISPGVSSPFSDAMLLPGALSGIGQGGGGNLGSYDAGAGIWGGNNPLTPENFQNLVGWENYQGNALAGAQWYPGQTPGPVINQPTAGGNYGNYLAAWNAMNGGSPGIAVTPGDFNQISHSGMTFAR